MSSVKVLPSDGRPNAKFPAWKKSVCLHMDAKFGSAGSVFRTGKYFIPPLLQRPSDEDLSADNNASGLKKAIILQALMRRDKNVEDFQNSKQYMYAESFSMISEECKGATGEFRLTSGKMPRADAEAKLRLISAAATTGSLTIILGRQ